MDQLTILGSASLIDRAHPPLFNHNKSYHLNNTYTIPQQTAGIHIGTPTIAGNRFQKPQRIPGNRSGVTNGIRPFSII